jgi:hypothetical protein
MNQKDTILDNENNNFPIIKISILIIIALCVRFIFFDNELPLVLDSLTYFSFSHETKILGHVPEIITFTNLGWTWVLTFFFNIFSFDSAIEYMNLQKIITMVISSLTIIPIYLLCKKFTEKKYAILAASLFIFDPRIIQNSLLGLTDVLYIFLMTFVFVLFFNIQKKYVYFAFSLAALICLIRAEGIFIFITISILFFIKFNNEKKIILKYLICLGIFLLILSPIIIERFELFQDEFLIQNSNELESIDKNLTFNIIEGIENFSKFFVWVTIPIYLVFLIPGVFLMIKKWKKENFNIIIPIIIMSIPIFYAYFIPAQDTRYLFVLFPFFCIISAFSINTFANKFQNTKKILPIILAVIIIISSLFIFEKMNSVHETESYLISKYLVENTQGINNIYPETKYIRSAEVVTNFPNHLHKNNFGEFVPKMDVFVINEKNLFEFIEKYENDGLTHIITDENTKRNKILVDLFKSENNYPFLEKILDTKELGWQHHFKIFKINYNDFKNNNGLK